MTAQTPEVPRTFEDHIKEEDSLETLMNKIGRDAFMQACRDMHGRGLAWILEVNSHPDSEIGILGVDLSAIAAGLMWALRNLDKDKLNL